MNASQARKNAENRQRVNYNDVIKKIKEASDLGYFQTPYYDLIIKQVGEKLVDMGYEIEAKEVNWYLIKW